MPAAMNDPDGVRGDGECGSRPLSPLQIKNFSAAIWSLDDELLNGPDYEEYQGIEKQCTTSQEDRTDKIDMPREEKDKRDVFYQNQSCEETFLPTEVENAYTGMNKQESRTARGAIEKFIDISAHIIAKVIVYNKEIFQVCPNIGNVTKSYKKHFDIIVGYPEPTIEQCEYMYILEKDTLCDIWTLKREEEVHCFSRHFYFYIMNFIKWICFSFDSSLHCIITLYLGCYITPKIRHILHKIYENDRNSIAHNPESFEQYIRRINKQINGKKFRVAFNVDERYEIAHYTLNNKFDISSINKLIDIGVDYHLLCVPSTVVDKYRDIKDLSRQIKDIRNDHFHNLPELDRTVCNIFCFWRKLNTLRKLVNNIENLI